MARFPTDRHAAAWAGRLPRPEHQRAQATEGPLPQGQSLAARCSGRNGLGRLALPRHLPRRALSSPPPRGKKRAIVAVSHTILVIIYHLLKDGTEYQDLGPDYALKRNADRVRRRSIQQLEALGYKVDLRSVKDLTVTIRPVPVILLTGYAYLRACPERSEGMTVLAVCADGNFRAGVAGRCFAKRRCRSLRYCANLARRPPGRGRACGQVGG